MQGKVLIVLLLVFIAMANAISVYTLDEQFSQTNQTVLRFKVENNSLDTLYGIELRYRVVQDTNNIASPDLYYLPGGMANWVFEDSVNATLIIYFPDLILYPGDTLGGSSGFAVGLHNKNWSAWTKNDDPSQPASHTFTLATNIDLLSNGKSLMLSGKKYPGCPVVQFVEIQRDSLTLQILQQLSSDTAEVIIKNRLGDSLIADFNSITTDSSGQKFWRGALATQDTVEHRGELRAECKGNLLSYFAFGWKPTGAESATMQSLWESNEAFVKANFDMGFNQGLSAGQRLALQRDSIGKYLDARLVNNWKFYRTWEEPGENPMPVVLSPVLMQYDADDLDSLTLEWSQIDAGDWYRLVVIRDTIIDDSVAFIDTTISLFTQRTLLSIPMLDPGNYMWYVEPLLEVSAEDHDDDAEYYYITGDAANTSAQSGSAPLMFRASFLTKLKKLAGKTVKTATLYARPVAYAGLSGLNFTSIVTGSIVRNLSPFGFIQIFLPDKALFTKINPITKNMDWLQYSYHDDFRYKDSTERSSITHINKFKQCFGPDIFCAMKDTRMLAETWRNEVNEDNWDKVFPKHSYNGIRNNSVSQRCWLTMAQMFNHHKGGNLSSDEILYFVRNGFRDVSGGGPIETMQAVNYALGLDVWDQIAFTLAMNTFSARGIIPELNGWSVGPLLTHTIVKTINSGNVLGVSQLNAGASGAHSMVLNGYRINGNGNFYIHLLNTDNMGGSEWRYYSNIAFLELDVFADFITNGFAALADALAGTNLSNNMFFSYYIPPPFVTGRSANPSVFIDTDGDGIVDFDEIKRFDTDPLNPDTDRDGISDYQEILDYKKCETYSNTFAPIIIRTLSPDSYDTINTPQISYVIQSDIDADGLHAAKDIDSDGDGYCDYQEEGYLTNNARSCERYDPYRHPAGVAPKCKNHSVALLAKERLQLNDRASCVTIGGAHCPIASYGADFNGVYGVSLGVQVATGSIYSYKPVLLRDRATVHGCLETANYVVRQSSTAIVTGATIENSVYAPTYSSIYNSVFDYVIPPASFNILQSQTINAGASAFTNIFGTGANHKDFNFNSGSKLFIDLTGNLLAGSLRFQQGAKLYAHPLGNLVFHIGNDFQWNGTIETNDMIAAAQRIKIYYYGTNRVFIHTDFAGTIIAPNAEVVIGQASKKYYGAIYAKSIVVHQNTKITWVPFVENNPNAVTLNTNQGEY